jgi:hypothetical protein
MNKFKNSKMRKLQELTNSKMLKFENCENAGIPLSHAVHASFSRLAGLAKLAGEQYFGSNSLM